MDNIKFENPETPEQKFIIDEENLINQQIEEVGTNQELVERRNQIAQALTWATASVVMEKHE